MPRRSLSFQACPVRAPCSWGQPRRTPDTPLAAPWIFFWGGRKVSAVVARPRDEATAPKTTCHGLQSSMLRLGLLSVLSWRPPSCLPIRVCPEGPPERQPPPPVELLRRGLHLPGGGSYVSPVSCVSLLCPYLVSFLSLFSVIIS